MTDNDVAITQLISMGFDITQANEALAVCNGDVERAINYLLSGGGGGGGGGAATATTTNNVRSTTTVTGTGDCTKLVVSDTSQYQYPDGRSACTCIALKGAQNFIQLTEQGSSSIDVLLSADFIQSMILEGIQLYQGIKSGNSGGVEHMSAEEVLLLASTQLSSLKLSAGGIRQGMLSSDRDHPLGLQAILLSCRSDNNDNGWVVVLMTKTPETILVCLPPSGNNNFIVIDSHPRPGVISGSNGESGAYVRIHGTMNDLIQYLLTIFVPTELGPDIPEMMAMMYNSFDLYPLVRKR